MIKIDCIKCKKTKKYPDRHKKDLHIKIKTCIPCIVIFDIKEVLIICKKCPNVQSKKHANYNCCQTCYRKAKNRFLIASKKHPDLSYTIEDFINNEYIRVKSPKQFSRRYRGEKYKIEKSFRTPKWVDVNEIALIYENCPENKQVDHIVPLKGENVSGLHVPWNLQYLTPSENYKKSNKV